MAVLSRPAGVSSERLRLLDDIEYALEPYLNSGTKPRLSPAQMFVVALLFVPDATFAKAMNWLLQNIPYYSKLAIDDFVQDHTGFYGGGHLTWKFFEEFRKVKSHYSAPLSIVMGETYNDMVFNTTPNDSRVFLDNLLASRVTRCRRRTPFRFWDLPTELRLRIYELVLVFPKSGIHISHPRDSKPLISAATRDMNDTNIALWQHLERNGEQANPNVFELNCPNLPKTLAVLLTSKEIFDEAMPIFYQQNTFVCHNTKDLSRLLRNSPQARRDCIRDIIFEFDPPTYREMSMAQAANYFKILKDMPDLRSLGIVINQRKWGYETKRNGNPKYPNLLNTAPLKMLKSMRGLRKVDFYGGYDEIGDVLKAEMVKPVPEEPEPVKKKRGGNKRKAPAGGDGEEGAKPGKKKKKKNKNKKAKASSMGEVQIKTEPKADDA